MVRKNIRDDMENQRFKIIEKEMSLYTHILGNFLIQNKILTYYIGIR